jgi:predicted DNA-binding transcriptional regulator AlpA
MRRPAHQLPHGFTPYMRASDLVAWLTVSRSTVYAWIAEGRIPRGIRVGGITLYNPRAVSEALGLDLEAR